jgi:amino acid transporter
MAYSLAKDGELPAFIENRLWFKSTEGLYLTAGLGLGFAVFFDLGEIATITSCVFTIIYLFVLVSHIRLRKKYGGNLVLLLFNLALLSAVFIALLRYQWQSHRHAFYGTLATLAGAGVVETVFRRIRNRTFTEHKKPNFHPD